MPSSHDDLLTPTEHEAAQLLVTLAWRLDGGQLASADQLLAKLCALPANDVAMASIVLLREVAHGVAPVLQRPSIEILDHLRAWLAGRAGNVRLARLDPSPKLPRGSAGVLPDRSAPSRYGRGSTRMANSAVTLLRRADAAQADPPERTWMSLTRLKTARFGDSIPSLPTAPSPVGSAGPRSALGPCHNGRARTPAVANRSEHLQVVDLPAQAAAMMQVGDSDCGPDGREGSRHPGRASGHR
jgi:hypothetical protein